MKSEVFIQRKDLSRRLGEMVLISMLTRNINFHYENVSFICENNKIIDLAPPIDHEFSTLSIMPDFRDANIAKQAAYDQIMTELSPEDKLLSLKAFSKEPLATITNNYNFSRNAYNNVSAIIKEQPEVAEEFINKLSKMRQYFIEQDIVFQDLNYIDEFNGKLDWMLHYYQKPDHYNPAIVEVYQHLIEEQGRSKIDIVDFGRYAIQLTIHSSNVLQNYILKTKSNG